MPEIKKRSYGMIPVAIAEKGEPLFLVLRAYRNWDFPKGGPDEDETPLDTAIREFREETGIAEFEMPWGDISISTDIYAGGKVATYFIAMVQKQELTLPISQELGRPEHDEYRWVDLDELEELIPPRLAKIPQWVADHLSYN